MIKSISFIVLTHFFPFQWT